MHAQLYGFLMLTLLLVSVPATALAADITKPPIQGPISAGPSVKSVGSNVSRPGGIEAVGWVILNAPAPANTIVQLSSGNPTLLPVPATVTVPAGQTQQGFTFVPAPVTTATSVVISAWIGRTEPKMTTFTVLPPALAGLGCKPDKIAGGESSTCAVSLNGPVARQSGVVVGLSSSNSAVATVPPTVTVTGGLKTASFKATAQSLPQSAPVTVVASYGGVSKTAPLTILPAAIKAFGCKVATSIDLYTSGDYQCRVIGGNYSVPPYLQSVKVGLIARLTAPAPYPGFKIKVKAVVSGIAASMQDLLMPDIVVPTGKDRGFVTIQTNPVASETLLTIAAIDPFTGDTRTVTINVLPPSVRDVYCGTSSSSGCGVYQVPLGGKKVQVRVRLIAPAPKGGMPFDVKYSGTTDVKGPSRIRVPEGRTDESFEITVSPCGVNPPCKVYVSAGGRTATVTVSP